MSSPFDNIDIPSDEPPTKAKYAREKRRLLIEIICIGIGIISLSSLSVTIYHLIKLEGDLDCFWRPIGAVIGGVIGCCLFGTFTFLLGAFQTVRKEVYTGKQGSFEWFALGGCLVGTLFGSAYGASLSTSNPEGKGSDFLEVGLLGGALIIPIYAIYKIIQLTYRKSNLEAEDYR